MDRFSWSDGSMGAGESLVTQAQGVDIYDGEDKVSIHGAYFSDRWDDILNTIHKYFLFDIKALWHDFFSLDSILEYFKKS